MIDLTKSSFLLKLCTDDISVLLSSLLTDTESIIETYQTIKPGRDWVCLTNARIIFVHETGIWNSGCDITIVPYSKIQSLSVETSGTTLDSITSITLALAGIGKVKFDFVDSADAKMPFRILNLHTD